MAVPEDRAFTGAFGRLLWNGKKVGYLQGCNGSERWEREEVREMGDPFLVEAPLLRVRCSLRADFIEVPSKGLARMGLVPRGTALEYFNFPPLTVELVTITGQLVQKAERVYPNGRDWRVDLNSAFRADVDFIVRRWFDTDDLG